MFLNMFSLGRAVLETVSIIFPLPTALVKNLAKHLVKILAKNPSDKLTVKNLQKASVKLSRKNRNCKQTSQRSSTQRSKTTKHQAKKSRISLRNPTLTLK